MKTAQICFLVLALNTSITALVLQKTKSEKHKLSTNDLKEEKLIEDYIEDEKIYKKEVSSFKFRVRRSLNSDPQNYKGFRLAAPWLDRTHSNYRLKKINKNLRGRLQRQRALLKAIKKEKRKQAWMKLKKMKKQRKNILLK